MSVGCRSCWCRRWKGSRPRRGCESRCVCWKKSYCGGAVSVIGGCRIARRRGLVRSRECWSSVVRSCRSTSRVLVMWTVAAKCCSKLMSGCSVPKRCREVLWPRWCAACRAALEKLRARPLSALRLVALFLDGVDFAGEMLIVAMGLDEHGHKHLLGLRQGGRENAEVCTSLLTELRERGLDTTRPILAVLDGSKALASAVKQVWGERALIQRCQAHKKRNMTAHLAAEHHAELDRRLNLAYHGDNYEAALKQLHDTATWLNRLNPDAANSLREGLEETLTVVKLGLSETLRKTLATTNPIESALDTTRTVTRRVKRWRDGSMKLRWCAAGLLKVEKKFRRIKGYRDIPKLIAALDALTTKPSTLPRKKSA